MEQSESIGALAKALCNVQKEHLFALTTSENPYFKSKYADLSSLWEVSRGPLTKNGLSVAQTMDTTEDGDVVIVTNLLHESGEWIRGRLRIKPVKSDPQALGSAITYGRRYSLSAILGIAQEDDDAEGAMKRGKKADPKPKSKPAAKEKPSDTNVDKISFKNKVVCPGGGTEAGKETNTSFCNSVCKEADKCSVFQEAIQ